DWTGHVDRCLAGQPSQEVAQVGQSPQRLGGLRIGDQDRLNQLLLIRAELAIHVGTQERIIIKGHVWSLRGKRARAGLASCLPGPSRGSSERGGLGERRGPLAYGLLLVD